MKVTRRSNWRVEVTFEPKTLADLGIPGVEANVITAPFTMVVEPKRLGDLGCGDIPDGLLRIKDPSAVYEERCDEIIKHLKDHVAFFVGGEVVCDEESICSHCGQLWEDVGEESAAASPEELVDPAGSTGIPVCCVAAQSEWFEERTSV